MMSRAKQQSQTKNKTLVVILVAVSCLAIDFSIPAVPPCSVPLPVWGPTATATLGSLATVAYKIADAYCSPENVLFRELQRSYPPIIPSGRVDYEVDLISAVLHQETGGCSVVYGPHHCGKTAYVSKKVCEMAEKRSVRYVEADRTETTFELVNRALLRRLFTQRWLAKFFSEPQWPTTLASLAELLKTVAERRKKKRLPVPIIVIDEVNRMLPGRAEDLVWFAKSLADAGAMHIVLLTSPGKRSIYLLKSSAMSRSELLLMPDPPKEAVQEALNTRSKTLNKYISPTDIDKIYNLTGGRWEDIDKVHLFMKRNEKFDFKLYKNSRFKAMETKVISAAREANVDEKHVWAFLKRVLKHGSVKLAIPSVTEQEHKTALALVEVNLLKTLMSEAGAVYVEFHGTIAQKFMETKP